MIKAQHSKVAEFIFSRYLKYLFSGHFYSIQLLGNVPQTSNLPLVLLPNHSSWWDGFFVHLLNEKILNKDVYLMMHEEQLAKNRFFSKIGVYSINPNSVSHLLESMKYTVELINNNRNRMIVFFPQGEMLPWDNRPIVYQRGVEYFRRKCGEFEIVQLGIKIEFLNQQHPQVFLKFGNIINSKSENSQVHLLENEHERLLEELKEDIITGKESGILFRGKRSVNEWFEDFRNFRGRSKA